jgi:hypothetical protein
MSLLEADDALHEEETEIKSRKKRQLPKNVLFARVERGQDEERVILAGTRRPRPRVTTRAPVLSIDADNDGLRASFQVLRVRAVDGDRGVDNAVRYALVAGDDAFAINGDTGIVYTLRMLDRESKASSDGAFILAIEATEDGDDGPSARTEVTIIVEVSHK